MKTYRIITNGKLFRVQHRSFFMWFDTIENKGISSGGAFGGLGKLSFIKSKVEFDQLKDAVDWIKEKEQESIKDKWREVSSDDCFIAQIPPPPERQRPPEPTPKNKIHPFSCPYPEGCNCGIGMNP